MTRKPDDWMPLHVRKYLGDTMHLTRDQHGAYLLLLMAYWMRGGPLPGNDNELAAIAKASRGEWARLRPALVHFFDTTSGAWVQKRAEEELAKARRLTEAKQAAGKKGAENRWQTNGYDDGRAIAEPLADEWQKPSQTDAPLPLPIPKKETKTMPANAGCADFEEFWKAYKPPPNAKKPEARKAWDATNGIRPALPDLLRAVQSYLSWLAEESRKQKREYPKQHPSTWLRGEVWNGFAPSGPLMTPEQLAEMQDRRDRLMGEGKYAPSYQ